MSSGVETSLAVLIRDSSTRFASLGMTRSRIDLRSNPKSVASPRITVRNLQRKIPVNVAELQQSAVKVLRRCLQLQKRKPMDLTRSRNVFVWLISDRRMSRLHRQFLGKTGPTDVLTFQHGEIFISVETAERHARVFGNPLVRELQLYIVHGLLHLHGFDDRTPAEAHKMKSTQERILRSAL
ncbi:MAG: rRNA maturation RNase YbeY [Verrucomicrobia bacterium]|nr:MAG: rRNA maturation RNase YbeY [Verrucomicrobiota bacterium]